MAVHITDNFVTSTIVPFDGINPNSPRIGISNASTAATIFDSFNQLPTNPAQLTATPSTAERWKESASNYHLWVSDVTGEAVDYVGIAAHRGLVGRQIKILYLDGGQLYGVAGPEIVTSNDPIFLTFPEVMPERVLITFQSDEDFEMEVGIIYFGKSVTLPRNIQVGHTPITYGRRTKKLISNSDNGQFLGQVKTAGSLGSSVSMDNVPPEYYRDELHKKFVIKAEVLPFFWAWRPQKWKKEVGFVWLPPGSDVSVSNTSPNGFMSIGFNMTGYLSND